MSKTKRKAQAQGFWPDLGPPVDKWADTSQTLEEQTSPVRTQWRSKHLLASLSQSQNDPRVYKKGLFTAPFLSPDLWACVQSYWLVSSGL